MTNKSSILTTKILPNLNSKTSFPSTTKWQSASVIFYNNINPISWPPIPAQNDVYDEWQNRNVEDSKYNIMYLLFYVTALIVYLAEPTLLQTNLRTGLNNYLCKNEGNESYFLKYLSVFNHSQLSCQSQML